MAFRARHARPLADLLTASRVLLAVYLAALGVTRGTEAVPVAVLTVIVSWLTDLVDGPLARWDPDPRISWVGEHDAEADLTTSLGVTAYLVLSGYVSPWIAAVLVAALLLVWILHSHQLAWPLYALPYVFLGAVAFREAPLFCWLAAGYLAATLAIRWSRLRQEFLPEFFQALASVLVRSSQHIPDTHNGQR
jgi:hypothetical protein